MRDGPRRAGGQCGAPATAHREGAAPCPAAGECRLEVLHCTLRVIRPAILLATTCQQGRNSACYSPHRPEPGMASSTCSLQSQNQPRLKEEGGISTS